MGGGRLRANPNPNRNPNPNSNPNPNPNPNIEKDLTRAAAGAEQQGANHGTEQAEGGGEADGDDEFGVGAVLPELRAAREAGGAADGEGGSQDVDAMLAAAGMVHTHVNDKVLGGRQLAAKDGAARDDDDDDDGFGGGGGAGGGGAGGGVKGEALPWARPSVKAEQGGVKSEGGGAKGEGEEAKSKRQAGDAEPPAAKRAKMNVVLHGSENEARQLT